MQARWRRLFRDRRPTAPWVTIEPHRAEPQPVRAFRLFAILGAWLEGDVIGATVRNAIAQGCERVYLLDNDSPDDTVAAATAAGAVLARSYASASYDEYLRLALMNEIVREVSRREAAEHIWWLWLDADEFHHGPRGLTLREYLAALDRRFRVVGARVFNHFPHEKPEYLTGFHPLEFQPLCEEFSVEHCPLGHWKHPLQRFDRDGPELVSAIGFHRVEAPTTLYEPPSAIFMHHMQYRDETVTRRRLRLLCREDADGESRIALVDRRLRGSGISKRHGTLDAVYARRWSEVASLRRQGLDLGVSPRPWTQLVDPADATYARWYTVDDVAQARAAWAERRAGSLGAPARHTRS